MSGTTVAAGRDAGSWLFRGTAMVGRAAASRRPPEGVCCGSTGMPCRCRCTRLQRWVASRAARRHLAAGRCIASPALRGLGRRSANCSGRGGRWRVAPSRLRASLGVGMVVVGLRPNLVSNAPERYFNLCDKIRTLLGGGNMESKSAQMCQYVDPRWERVSCRLTYRPWQ